MLGHLTSEPILAEVVVLSSTAIRPFVRSPTTCEGIPRIDDGTLGLLAFSDPGITLSRALPTRTRARG